MAKTEFDTEAKRAFLAAFRELGTITAACRQVGVGRTTAFRHRQQDEDFALAWAEIDEEVVERMEREAFRRAVEGTTKPLVSAGRHVTDVTEYSDSLLQFLLKGRRPERYRDNVKVEHSGRIVQRTELDLSKLTDEQLAQLEAIRDALEA